MRSTTLGLSLALIAGAGAFTLAPSAAAPAADNRSAGEAQTTNVEHVLPNPQAEKQQALRQQAWAEVLSGEATPQTINGTTVLKTGKKPKAATRATANARGKAGKKTGTQDQYVELGNERTDEVFVLLVDFGTQRHPDYPDRDTSPATPGPVKFDGPGFNEIPKPGPDDNSTQWRKNFNKKYYQDLYFGDGELKDSLKSYYERQSSGRYSVDGMVTNVVTVPYNQARYGRSDGYPCASNVCSNTWNLVEDAMTQWVADQKAAGKTDAQIKKIVSKYDLVDRYDFDGDGNFNEPDGYIDRFQIIHAGGDQADGDPIYGEDAIWSHRWKAFQDRIGTQGPANNLDGGTQIGSTGIWVADYTIQPENGGISVVAHEYGHDLGLPDHYDTAASGDNPVSWWTLMAQSRVSATGDQGIGTRAADLGVWDKLQLGWLDYETVVAGQDRTIDLGPHEYNTSKAQGVAVVLPDKVTTTTLPTPPEGTKQWYSGAGDGYSASMSRADLAVPATGTTTLSLKAAWNIEEDYDFGFLEVEAPAGSGTWTALDTSAIDPDTDAAAEPAIDGVSDGYVDATFDLSAYAGQTVGFRARYVTDGAVQGQDPDLGWSGLLVDDISVTNGGATAFADGAETSPNGWTLDGFSSVGASFDTTNDQFYLASNRSYVSYDKYLQTGPYNFSFPDRPDFVEKFPYQDGLLVNYWDSSYSDNNTSQHPGGGLVLPVDANPYVHYNLQGQAWRGRIQNYDAPFGLQTSDSFYLTAGGRKSYIRGRAANPLFDDSDVNRYFQPFADAGLPRVGVKVAGVGVKIEVLSQDGTSMRIRVR
ncbi:immune inhibitor A domain-containing protein [Nocardioides hwasunensis]|uniref:Immune inhibitor A n=1 Tax=Nocardioides hwasunensis TaxID=397258 RepID=A0ABR8MJX7_9ACTN|nr:immune inhibitor A domain-containing protein [Nocardioides hwasunensis]MBD3916248.1 immune inhibitor A [Nocardioides hwasunensis]